MQSKIYIYKAIPHPIHYPPSITLSPTAKRVAIYGSVQRRASPARGKVQHLAAEPVAAQRLWKLEREVGVEVAANEQN
jgi:hypothetical protein